MISCIYTITNVHNGKMYVGKTNDFHYRVSKHKYTLRNKIHINEHLQRAWDKYGEESFMFEILDEVSEDLLISLEHYWCNILNVHDYLVGYNIRPTHPHNKGSNSKATSEKISKSLVGRKASDEAKKKMSNAKKGKTLSEEQKRKISESLKGKPKSDDAKNNISAAKLGDKNPRFGKIP